MSVDADQVRRDHPIADVIAASGVKLERAGRGEFKALCPFHSERTPSFTVSTDKGFYHCFGCGAHGDVLDFVRRRDGVGFLEAVEALEGARPSRKIAAAPPPRLTASADLDRVGVLWASGVSATGTLVETYLRSRGLELSAPRSLRYHPALPYWDGRKLVGRFPAMLAAVQSAAGAIVACHRTYLAADGRGKAAVTSPRKLQGSPRGGAIRFARPAYKVAIAEGIETALTLFEATPGLAVWSAISAGGMAALEFPPAVREVVFWFDRDRSGVGERAARLAANLASSRGLIAKVVNPPPGEAYDREGK